ncbi:hypothetical protein C1X72_26110 [Pseudomonas sp. FW306-2-2C-D06B]|nr:hypothetical protein C1X72_26110 [Pseudomonas sp. FW306-2-2C-D06B]
MGCFLNNDAACTGPFAGTPAPTDTMQFSGLWWSCGSGRAREEAGTGNGITKVFFVLYPASSHPL